MLIPKDILQAAIDIAENLLQQEAKHAILNNKNVISPFSLASFPASYHKESVYDGYAGVGLFLLALYKQTKKERYLSICQQIADELIAYCDQKPANNFTFFTGRGGVSYFLLQLFEVNYEEYYIHAAIDLTFPNQAAPPLQKGNISDLMTGNAGTLLTGLHLHQHTENRQVLGFIEQFADSLVKSFRVSNKGMYWNPSHQYIQPLCGFAHGNAGIAWVLLELGFYLDNEVFIQMAEQAFAYEKNQWNQALNNYPDFTKRIHNRADYDFFKEKYLHKDPHFFTQPTYPNKWNYGAAGIGLSRLRAFQLLHKETYRKEAMSCMQLTVETDVDIYQDRSFYLYQGSGGAVDVLLEAYLVLQEEKYLAYAQQVAYQSIIFNQNQPKLREQKGLLTGETGLGYFYLRAFNPHLTPSILCPKLSQEAAPITDSGRYPSLTMFESELVAQVVQRVYPRTFELLNQLHPDGVIEYLSQSFSQQDILATFEAFMAELPTWLSTKQQQLVGDVYALEQLKQCLQDSIPSYALLHMAQLVQEEKLAACLEKGWATFLKQSIQVHPDAVLHHTIWNWQLTAEDWAVVPDHHNHYTTILCPTIHGGIEEILTPFTQTIWQKCTHPQFVQDVVIDLKGLVVAEQQKAKDIENKILLQIKQFLKLGVLVFVLE